MARTALFVAVGLVVAATAVGQSYVVLQATAESTSLPGTVTLAMSSGARVRIQETDVIRLGTDTVMLHLTSEEPGPDDDWVSLTLLSGAVITVPAADIRGRVESGGDAMATATADERPTLGIVTRTPPPDSPAPPPSPQPDRETVEAMTPEERAAVIAQLRADLINDLQRSLGAPPPDNPTSQPEPQREWPDALPRGPALSAVISEACPAAPILGRREPDPFTRDEGCRVLQREAYRGLERRRMLSPDRRRIRSTCQSLLPRNLVSWNDCEEVMLYQSAIR